MSWFVLACIEYLFVVESSMIYQKLLEHLDSDLLFMKVFVHVCNSLFLWYFLNIQLIVYNTGKFDQGLIYKILFEKFILKLSAAHQKSFKH